MKAYDWFFWAALLTLIRPHSVAGLSSYQHFFPSKREALIGLINTNCSTQYEAFLHGIPAPVSDPLLGYWGQTEPGWAVDNCLLDAARESVKADFSSAQVILALMPSIFGSLGPSSQELSLLLVLGNRQLLALSLALGSPFTNGVHSLDFAREIESLPRFDDGRSSVYFKWQAGAPFLYFQYFIVFAAIANIAELSYEFAQNASSTIIQQSPNFLPGLMAITGFAMHLLVAFAFHFCVNVKNRSIVERSQTPKRHLTWFKRWTSQQLCAIHGDSQRYVEVNTANVYYTLTSWFAKIAIFTHVGWHVVAFSTVLFVSSLDAVVLLFRYFASVCLCRMVAANEIAVLGMTVKRGAKTQDSQICVHTSPGAKDTTYDRVSNEGGIPLKTCRSSG